MGQELAKLYQKINQRGIAAIKDGQLDIDDFLGGIKEDNRWGLTLLGHLPAHLNRNISFALQEIKLEEPGQYYYPAADRHVTIMDIVGAKAGQNFTLDKFNAYCHLLRQELVNYGAIHWSFNGLMVSQAAIMVKGYYSSELERLRSALRQRIPAVGLELAERYPTISGHVTVARFATPLRQPQVLLKVVQDDGQLPFGSFTMTDLDLVVHDWYNRKTKLVQRIPLVD